MAASYSLLSEVWNEPWTEPFTNFGDQTIISTPAVQNADLLSEKPQQQPITVKPNVIAPPIPEKLSSQTELQELREHVKYLESIIHEKASRDKRPIISTMKVSSNDFLIYIAIGAFFIFIFDSFLQLGSRLK